jgi:hypothetical protein
MNERNQERIALQLQHNQRFELLLERIANAVEKKDKDVL